MSDRAQVSYRHPHDHHHHTERITGRMKAISYPKFHYYSVDYCWILKGLTIVVEFDGNGINVRNSYRSRVFLYFILLLRVSIAFEIR